MSTPTIRKVSNVGGLSNNNNNSVDSPTTNTSPPIRPVSRVVRVLSSSSKQVANNTSTDNNNNNASTSTVDQQQQQQQTPSTTTTTTTDNNTSEAPKKKVIVRVVKRTVGTSGATSEATTTNNVPSLANTPSNDNNNTNDNNESNNNNSSGTITATINNNNNISSNNNLQSSTIKNEVSTPSSTPSNDEVSTSTNTTTTNPTTTTPRTTKIADRWLQRTQTNAPTTVTTTPVTSTASVSTPTTTTAAATPTTTTEPTTPKRRVRSITNREEKPTDASSTTTTATATNSTPSVTNGSTITTESTNINSTNPQFGAKLASAANRDLKSNSTIVAPSTQTPVVVSPHQTSKSMNDIPQPNSIKDKINKLNPSLKLLTPEQLMMDKKADRGSDNIRPLRPLEIATWYGGSVSVATEDPMFDSSSIDDLRKEAPDVYYSNFLFNPLFDEQSACDTPTITMSSQEILIYNFVVELMRKKYSNLLALDPIAFEEEMKNASSLPSLTLKNISSSHTRTDSVTSSTEDVLTGEDIGYPINKCSKNWKYQLKKKRENTKSTYNPTDGMFTPRASVQLQTSSPSSPATANSAAVNPLFDHLYYMPCWKHQIQLETIVKRSGEQRKVQ